MEEPTPPAPPVERTGDPPAPEPAGSARPVVEPHGQLGYRSPADEPGLRPGSVVQGAVAICLACFAVLIGVPGVAWIFSELIYSDRGFRRETYRIYIACAIVLLSLGGLYMAIATARDYLSGRNQQRAVRRQSTAQRD